jgi:hypothetical protein
MVLSPKYQGGDSGDFQHFQQFHAKKGDIKISVGGSILPS